jgi:hypothetical protein
MKYHILFNIKAVVAVAFCLLLAGFFSASLAFAQTNETFASTTTGGGSGGGSSSPSVERKVCMIGKQMFRVGTVRSSITGANVRSHSSTSTRFVCRLQDGKAVWVKTAPRLEKPTNPVCIKGKSGYDGSGRPGTAECLLSEPVKPASTTPPQAITYGLADVTSITKQVVAGSRMLADGGHTLYTVTLKNGRKIEVKVSSGPITASMVEAEFRKTGYTGNVSELLARAKEQTPVASSTYTLADIKSVTKQFVDPSAAIADEEYTLYVITLQSGRKIEVKVYGRTMPGTTEAEFRKTGYTGNVADLTARATEVGKPTATTTSAAPRVTFVAGTDGLYNATVVVARPAQPRVVTGPTGLGTINWGDGVTESLIGLISGTEMTVKVSHRYKRSGTYTVVVTDSNGKTVSQKIEVKTITGVTPRITSLVSTSGRSYTATVVLGRPTQNVIPTGPIKLGTISWGNGVTENLFGLVTGNEMTVTRSHTYRTVGTFTVTVTGLNGVSVSQKVVVSTSTPRTGTPTPSTAVPSGLSAPAAGAVRGATTDVYQNIATVLVSLKQLLDTLEAK